MFRFCNGCNKTTDHYVDKQKREMCYPCYYRSICERSQLMELHSEKLMDKCNCFYFHNVPMICMFCEKKQGKK